MERGGGRLKGEIHILFYRDNSWNVALKQMKFGTAKEHECICKFYFNNYFWQSS
jgi:hypothetical protein